MKLIAALLLVIAPAFLAAQSPNDVGIPAPASGTIDFESIRGTGTGSGSFDGTEATMSPRFFRGAVIGEPCEEFASGDFQFQTVDFLTDGSGVLDVTFDPGESCDTGIYVTFHEAPFNPADICQGYVWAFGSSNPFSESFTVPADTEMQMVVSAVFANAPDLECGEYTYGIQGIGDPPPAQPALAVPTMSHYALLLLGLMLGLFGLAVVRQQS